LQAYALDRRLTFGWGGKECIYNDNGETAHKTPNWEMKKIWGIALKLMLMR
jgi:hypothetical protein